MRRASSAGRPTGGRAPRPRAERCRAARLRRHAGAAVRLHAEQARRVRGLPPPLPVHLRRPADPARRGRRGRTTRSAPACTPPCGTGTRCRADRAPPRGAAHAAQGRPGSARATATTSRSGHAFRRALGWLESLRGRRSTRPTSRSASSGWWRPRPRCWRFNGRVDRIDPTGAGGRAGHRRLQDRPRRARRRRRARLAGAGAVRVRGRAGVPPAVPPGRAAPPADRHGRRARAHRRSRWPGS